MSDFLGGFSYWAKLILPYVFLWIVGAYVSIYIARWHHPRRFDGMDIFLGTAFWPVVWLMVAVYELYMGLAWLLEKAWNGIAWAGRKVGLDTLNPFILTDRLIARITRRKISQDEFGELYVGLNPQEGVWHVKVSDKTGIHWLRVPPGTKSPKDGVAWTYNMRGSEYSPSIRV